MSRAKTVWINLSKDVQVDVTGHYVHDDSIEDCEFNITNVKQSSGTLLQLIEALDDCKHTPITELQNRAIDQLHAEEIDRKPFLLKK